MEVGMGRLVIRWTERSNWRSSAISGSHRQHELRTLSANNHLCGNPLSADHHDDYAMVNDVYAIISDEWGDNASLPIANLETVLLQRQLPTITLWNRLEGRPRTHDFDRALKAEVRDALWMLTRQWQMGEFQGDDAGSPVFAKIHMDMARLEGYQASTHPAQPFDFDLPLETQVEQRPIPFKRGEQAISLDIRLLMGRQWLKLMRPIGDFNTEFYALYAIDPPVPTQKTDAEICAHNTTWQMVAAVAQRAMDGYKLYEYLTRLDTNHAYDGTSIP
jgi:hypothetical protein